MITRRTLLAGSASAALALPVLANDMVDLRLPGGPSLRPLEPSFHSIFRSTGSAVTTTRWLIVSNR